MTAGFVAFAAGVGAYSSVLRDHKLRAAARAAKLTAAATLAIAMLPLGGSGGDGPHAAAAGVAYAALAAMPLLAARPLSRRGAHWAASASIATGITVAGALAASVVLPRGAGLAQRVGLTVGDLWIMVSASRSSERTTSEPPGTTQRAPDAPVLDGALSAAASTTAARSALVSSAKERWPRRWVARRQ